MLASAIESLRSRRGAGIGGLEAVIDNVSGVRNTVLNDRFGNVLGYAPVLQPSSSQWSSARFNGYGPTVGYDTPFLASGIPLIQALAGKGSGAISPASIIGMPGLTIQWSGAS